MSTVKKANCLFHEVINERKKKMNQATYCTMEEYSLLKRILASQQQEVVLETQDVNDDILLNDVACNNNETRVYVGDNWERRWPGGILPKI